jgi:hypothetical protein
MYLLHCENELPNQGNIKMGHRPQGLGRVFLVHRKAGRFSPKSYMMFFKAGPTFTTLTPQQVRVKQAGIKCGAQIRGQYKGSGNVQARRDAMGACIREEFGYTTKKVTA